MAEDDITSEPTVEESADLLTQDARAFLSSGSEEAAERFADDLQSIANRGSDYLKGVFAEMEKDAGRLTSRVWVASDQDDTVLTITCPVAEGLFGMNYRTIGAYTDQDTAYIDADVTRNFNWTGGPKEISLVRELKQDQ